MKADLVGIRLMQKVFGFSLSVVIIRRKNPVQGFLFVHLPIVVFVSELGKLLTFRRHPLRLVAVV